MSKTIGIVLAMQDQVSPILKKVAEKLELNNDEVKELHNNIKKMSKEVKKSFDEVKKSVAGLAVGFSALAAAGGMMINKTVEAGDRIDKMSQKIGMTRQSFQKWDYVLSQSGTDIEKMQVGMKTMSQQMVASTKNGSEAQKMFKMLGVSVKDSKGNFKSQEQAFEEIIRAFQKMPDGIQKANLAQKLFGKTGSDLRPLLNGVRGNIDELTKKFDELGLGMSDTAIDSAVKFKDTMDTIQRSLQGAMYQIGADILPAIQSIADSFIKNMPKIKETVMPVMNALVNVFKFCAEHIELLTNVAVFALTTFAAFKTLMTVVAVIKAVHTVIQMVTIAQGIWNAVMLANPIGLIVVGIAALIGVIALLVKNWDKVKAAAVACWESIKKGMQWVIDHWYLFGPLGAIFKGGSMVADKVKQIGNQNKEKKQKYASGTSGSLGGLALVGESGPELVNLPTGAKVTNSNETKNIMNKDIVINLNVAGNVIGNGEFINQIKIALGSELQKALAV